MNEKKSTYKGFTPSRAEANKRYIEKFSRVEIRMSPEKREILQAHAETRGESLNGYINKAIDERMEREALTNE